jgi:SNF2 family DNA or RNA helicase
VAEFYHDQGRNLLIYPTRQPDRFVHYIPDAKPINGAYVAVPRNLRNLQTLRHFGIPVTPIMDGYDWPASPGIRPWETQKLAANFLVLHPRCFNLSDMGVGKTLSALWAADWLMRHHTPGTCRALIVAPLSILQSVWANAIFRNFLGRRSYDILYGDAEKRLKILSNSKADFLICNFDGVGVGAHSRKKLTLDGFSRALADTRISVVIVDEASGYRDATTKRHRIAREVIGGRDYLWLLTGTPTPNAPTDAYGLAKMVNNAGGKSFRTFQQETMVKWSNFVWKPRKDGYERAQALLTPAIRIDIKEVWDGPAVTVQQREIPLTPEQKKLMADLKRDLQLTIKSGQPITAANEAAARQKFLQISLGAVYDQDHKAHAVDAMPRLKEAESVIESTDRPIVCFVPLTSVVNLLHVHLSKRWECAILNGEVAPKDRVEVIKRFAQGGLKVLIADPQTTAHGINEFVVADTVLWLAPIDKTELYLQGNKRVNRPGQKYPVSIVQFVSNPLEREMFRRLENNESLQGALLDLVRKGQL